MRHGKTNRRQFLKSGVAAGATLSTITAASHARVVGANDRINIGLIGCGTRGRWVMKNMVHAAAANTRLVAINDIWKLRLETYPSEAEQALGAKPEKVFDDYRKVLDDPAVDAVIIATPAHQHCVQTTDAVKAGKHVYVEKPIATVMRDVELLNKCHDAVNASGMAVQNGSQGVSCPGVRAVKKLVAEGTLGKLFRVESCETATVPYWMRYEGPEKEADTNWKAFLFNREDRPFDAHMHAKWMGYHDFSSGTIGGWMSHFINTVHFITGCAAPVAATTFGGAYAPTNDARCDAPDQVTVVLEYAEGFLTQFVSHFGSSIDGESTVFMFEKGTVRTRFGHNVGNPTVSAEGVQRKFEAKKLLDVDPIYPGVAHVTNWLDCIRNGGKPNANMDYGYKQGIAVTMGDASYSLGRKVVFDKAKREIRPA